MIDHETTLRIQAYLDNELGVAESKTVATLLDRDPEARALYTELKGIRTLLEAGEPELKVPETREFYWSKIERSLQPQTVQPSQSAPSMARPWWRVFATLAGVTVLLVAALSLLKLSTAPIATSYLHEIETPLEDTSAISFHSQSAGMTVVWVQSPTY
jgi:anti-sigma factor RsiW